MRQLLFFVFEFIRIIKLLFTHSEVVAFPSLKEQKFPAEISLILTQKSVLRNKMISNRKIFVL